jgi:cytochrome P450
MPEQTETSSASGALRELPGHFALPLLGDTLAFLKDPAGFFTQRARELGPVYRVNILGDDVACFVGPEAFQLFLDERYFTRAGASPPHVQELMDPNAVPFLDGDRFRRRKELLMQIFRPEALEGYASIIEQVIGRRAQRWAEQGSISWVPELTSMAMTAAGALFLGSSAEQEDVQVTAAFQAAFGGFLALPVNLPFSAYGKALKARDFLRARIAAVVEEHQKAEKKDAMAQALAARTKDGDKLSADEVKIETFHFFGAYVPVIGGLSFLAMLLGQHPEVKERARAEVKEKLAAGPITPAGLRPLSYLDCVCKESRRVQPIIPISFFAKVKEECAFQGIRIPKGVKAVGCIAPTLQDSSTYADPAKFDPDRWQGGRAGERQHAAWVPHGGGAHLVAHRCAGEQLADLMLKTFAAILLRDYDWTLPPQDFAPTTGALFATPRGGLKATFKRL